MHVLFLCHVVIVDAKDEKALDVTEVPAELLLKGNPM